MKYAGQQLQADIESQQYNNTHERWEESQKYHRQQALSRTSSVTCSLGMRWRKLMKFWQIPHNTKPFLCISGKELTNKTSFQNIINLKWNTYSGVHFINHTNLASITWAKLGMGLNSEWVLLKFCYIFFVVVVNTPLFLLILKMLDWLRWRYKNCSKQQSKQNLTFYYGQGSGGSRAYPRKKALVGNATSMHLEGRRKPKYPEETQAEQRQHLKLYTNTGPIQMEPESLELWGGATTHCTATSSLCCHVSGTLQWWHAPYK